MIGINRIAQDFKGTIHGRKETVSFGDQLDFYIFTSDIWTGPHSTEGIANEIRSIEPGQFDLVIGAGYTYGEPFTAIAGDYPEQKFIAVDSYQNIDNIENITELQFSLYDAAFIGGVIAVERFGGRPLGVIGGGDYEFIHENFFNGFRDGIDYMDGLSGTNTDLRIAYANGFGDYGSGYHLAEEMYANGVE